MKKRLPMMTGFLLAGIGFAGGISHIIEAPKRQNDYLHEHLTSLAKADNDIWSSSAIQLPDGDRQKIAAIITKTDTALTRQGLDKVLTGQALEQALATIQDKSCALEQRRCKTSIRLGRGLSENHVNGDYRAANIQDTSLRVDFSINPETQNILLNGLYDETRILQFYQTQAGWVQNATRIITQTPRVFSGHNRDFDAKFFQRFVGLNYYPAAASWRDFWRVFPLDDISHDLEQAKALNVNALRIFLTHDYFDAADTRAEALERLQIFLNLCQEKDIQVLLTFFDLRPDYRLSNWASDIRHIDHILENIADHKVVLGIDLKNQPDLDFDNWGEGLVEAWLTILARHIQSQYPKLPVTAGWSNAQDAARLHRIFDIVTYHEYENPKGFAQRLDHVKTQVGDKPVMITELGATIWKPPFIKSHGEIAQASRLGAQLSQARAAHGLFVWTLNDFDYVSKEVVGPLPWRRAQQKHFGLLRPDGSKRPAAQVLKDFGAGANNGHENGLQSPNYQNLQIQTAPELRRAHTVNLSKSQNLTF